MESCEHASGAVKDKSIRCSVLAQSGSKWDFCIHQYFCRERGKYRLSNDAATCKLKESKAE